MVGGGGMNGTGPGVVMVEEKNYCCYFSFFFGSVSTSISLSNRF